MDKGPGGGAFLGLQPRLANKQIKKESHDNKVLVSRLKTAKPSKKAMRIDSPASNAGSAGLGDDKEWDVSGNVRDDDGEPWTGLGFR